jgi:hypothetical protein
MADGDELGDRLRSELEVAAPDAWPRIRQWIRAERVASQLLAALEGPPSTRGRLYWEFRFRLRGDLSGKAGAS